MGNGLALGGIALAVVVIILGALIFLGEDSQQGGGTTLETFLDLTDTPGTYAGTANQLVTVNGSSTGLVFSVISGSAMGAITGVGDVAQGEAFTPSGGGWRLWFHDSVWSPLPRIELRAPASFGSSGTLTLPVTTGTIAVTTDYTLQTVTDNGNTTTNSITFAGGSSTAILDMQGNDLDNVDSILGNGTYVRIGTDVTSHGLNADEDLLVSGDFEVNGLSYLDGGLQVTGVTALQNTTVVGDVGVTGGVTATSTISASAFDGATLWNLVDTDTGTNNADASVDDVLVWNGTDWVTGTRSGVSSLWQLNDTNTGTNNSSASVGEALMWDGADWSPSAVAVGTPNLQDVTDQGNTTTNPIQFAGGTSTAGFSVSGTVSASDGYDGLENNSISDLGDVNTGTWSADANDGDALKWNDALGEWEPGTVSVTSALWELTDTNTGTSNADANPGQALVWNGTQSAWIPGTVAATTPDWQAVTDVGNTTTNRIEFNGGTSNASIDVMCADKTYTGSNSPLVFSGTNGYIPGGVTLLYVIAQSGSMGAKQSTLHQDNGVLYQTISQMDETYPAQSLHAYLYTIPAFGIYVTVVTEDTNSARMLAYMDILAGNPPGGGAFANYASPVYTWSGVTEEYTWVGTPTVCAATGTTSFVNPPTVTKNVAPCIELQTDGDIVASGSVSAAGNVLVEGTIGSSAYPGLIDPTAGQMNVYGNVSVQAGGNVTAEGYINATNYLQAGNYVQATNNVETTSGIFRQYGSGINLLNGSLSVYRHGSFGNSAGVADPQVVSIGEWYQGTVGTFNAYGQFHTLRVSGRIRPSDSGTVTGQTWGIMSDVTMDLTQGSGTLNFMDQVVGLEGSAYAEVPAGVNGQGSVIGIQAYSRGSIQAGNEGSIMNSYNAFFVFEPNLTTYGNASGLQLIVNATDIGGVQGNFTFMPMITNMSGNSFVGGDVDYIDCEATNLTDNASINNWTVINIREPALSGSAQITGDQTGIVIWDFADQAAGVEREILLEGEGELFFRDGTDKRIGSLDQDHIDITAPDAVDINADWLDIEDGYLEMDGVSDPGSPPADTVRIWLDTSGAKDILYANFNTGTSQVIAAEP